MNDAAMLKQYRRQIKKLEAHIKEVNLTLHTFEKKLISAPNDPIL